MKAPPVAQAAPPRLLSIARRARWGDARRRRPPAGSMAAGVPGRGAPCCAQPGRSLLQGGHAQIDDGAVDKGHRLALVVGLDLGGGGWKPDWGGG
jgi:hypothetical protein